MSSFFTFIYFCIHEHACVFIYCVFLNLGCSLFFNSSGAVLRHSLISVHKPTRNLE